MPGSPRSILPPGESFGLSLHGTQIGRREHRLAMQLGLLGGQVVGSSEGCYQFGMLASIIDSPCREISDLGEYLRRPLRTP